MLSAEEILRQHLASDLVVLSACETGRGRIVAGEGKIGLAWALAIAGSPSVVVSQWNVMSASTAALMVAFHTNLLAAGSRPFAKAEALRAAQRHLLENTKYRHPYYWAAFTLVGSP